MEKKKKTQWHIYLILHYTANEILKLVSVWFLFNTRWYPLLSDWFPLKKITRSAALSFPSFFLFAIFSENYFSVQTRGWHRIGFSLMSKSTHKNLLFASESIENHFSSQSWNNDSFLFLFLCWWDYVWLNFVANELNLLNKENANCIRLFDVNFMFM